MECCKQSNTSNAGGMVTASWLWGTIAENYSLQYALLGSAALVIGGALVGSGYRYRNLIDLILTRWTSLSSLLLQYSLNKEPAPS